MSPKDFTAGTPKRLEALFERIGYQFKDVELVQRALTHASYGDGRRNTVDNERLEFLGDRVLGLLTAKLLFDQTKTKEGIMATRLNALVRKETCARVAQRLDIGSALLMSNSEDKQGGRGKTSILGDACEALMAALYIDGGYSVVEKFYNEHWREELDNVLNQSEKDPKTQLQEFALSKKLAVPYYYVKERSGPDHKPNFIIGVKVEGIGEAFATGTSKKLAERRAAKSLLEQIEET
ncbi:RNAse III [Litorimonas taeanensis]|uniref:Ribonuclease 3 n=1 Tax=Litorimonas taeanensis TaxID=568099 RepID=A0A420WKG9_9PROT|nr:ribonuclease III [Litorimonas taeanensis]RKQ71449.1 RNAse III [Litorimonas taeanensis]